MAPEVDHIDTKEYFENWIENEKIKKINKNGKFGVASSEEISKISKFDRSKIKVKFKHFFPKLVANNLNKIKKSSTKKAVKIIHFFFTYIF